MLSHKEASFIGAWDDWTEEEKKTIEWDGYKYPRTVDEEGQLVDQPDAYPTDDNLLPHQHHDVYPRFPAAVARPAFQEEEYAENDMLEKAGVEVGYGMEEEEVKLLRIKAIPPEEGS